MELLLTAIKDLPRPTWDQYFMSVAYLIGTRSSCSRLHVGCVITRENRIVSTGYNGHLPGAPHTSLVRDGHEQMTVHAESNAVTDAAKRGVLLADGIAYITHSPCINCCKLLIQSGVRHIVYGEEYRPDSLVQELCLNNGIRLTKYT